MSSTQWHTQDANLLKTTRITTDLPIEYIAKFHSLSVGQVLELENGGCTEFVSEEEKHQIGAKVLKTFGKVPHNAVEFDFATFDLSLANQNRYQTEISTITLRRLLLVVGTTLKKSLGSLITTLVVFVLAMYLIHLHQLAYLMSSLGK